LAQDVRYAVRGLKSSPGVTAVALLSLMLGIGAGVTMFSVEYGAMIAPFPYAEPKNIWMPAMVAGDDPMREWGQHLYTLSEFQEIEKLPAFSAVMAVREQPDLVTGGDLYPETLIGIRLTGGAFDFLGIPALLGRTIQPDDVHPGGDPAPVVVLSYRDWMRAFHGEARAVGRNLILNKVPHTVIGVMPSRFGWWTDDAFWVPMSVNPARETPLNVFMRLRPGISDDAASQQLSQLDQHLAAINPAHFPKRQCAWS
jgi:hypothetical protein